MTVWDVYGDWGNTNLRLWKVEGGVATDSQTLPGMSVMVTSPATSLEAGLSAWTELGRPRRIILCGMAGARAGLHETPYAECPLEPSEWSRQAVQMDFGATPLKIAAGCAMPRSGRPDVMRGEETQVFGAVSRLPRLANGSHTLVLPGTHSKWVRLAEGAIDSFRTTPTGELYALLLKSSMLILPGDGDKEAETAGFTDGVERTRDEPGLISTVFTTRAAQLRLERSTDWARGYLSGLLIGHEIVENILRDRPSSVEIVCDGALASLYRQAFDAFDIPSNIHDGDACVLEGLRVLNDLG